MKRTSPTLPPPSKPLTRMTRAQAQSEVANKKRKRAKGQHNPFERHKEGNVVRLNDMITVGGKIKVEQNVKREPTHNDQSHDVCFDVDGTLEVEQTLVKEEIDLTNDEKQILVKREPDIVILETKRYAIPAEHVNLEVESSAQNLQNKVCQTARKIPFPAFLKVFFNWFGAQDVKYANGNSDSQELKNILTKCRQICPKWKSEVDKLLDQTAESGVPFYSYRFDDNQDTLSALKFQNHFDTSHLPTSQNPFLVRKVEITVHPYGNPEALLQLLTKYGSHIWYCSLSVTFVIIPETFNYYHWIKSALTLLPNVKSLFITVYLEEGNNTCHVDKFTEDHVLPTFKNLKLLRLSDSVPPITLQELLYKNPNVTELGVATWHNLSNPPPQMLSNLQKLAVTFEPPWAKTKTGTFANFMELQVNWKLKKLSVNLQGAKVEPYVLSQFLSDNFAETLRELTIVLPSGNWTSGDLQLKKLESLTFYYVGCFERLNLDVIVPTRDTLKKLAVYCGPLHVNNLAFLSTEYGYQCEQNRIIKLYSCHDELHTSNLWTLFPNLEKLTYSDYGIENICTRN